jgi:hypothetical protein
MPLFVRAVGGSGLIQFHPYLTIPETPSPTRDIVNSLIRPLRGDF